LESLRAMRLFVCAVREGSFSAAGRRFGLSPASVSRQINALEDALAVRLVNRTSRRLTLTEAGELYCQRAEAILREVSDMNDAVSQFHSAPRGLLRVHCRIMLGTQHVAPALPGFLERYPDIQVDLMLSDGPVDLVGRSVDVDIRIGKLDDSALVVRKLADSERVLCASPCYLARCGEPRVPADLAAHNCLTYRMHMGRILWRFQAPGGAVEEIAVSGNLQVNSGEVLRRAALDGVGIALMPDWSVAEDIRAGRLRRLLPRHRVSFAEFETGVYAVYLHSRHRSAKLQVFIDYLASVLPAAWGPVSVDDGLDAQDTALRSARQAAASI